MTEKRKERQISFYADDPIWDNIKVIQDYSLNEGMGNLKINQIVRESIFVRVKNIKSRVRKA